MPSPAAAPSTAGHLAPFPGFTGATYLSQSPLACQARSVNLYPERIEDQRGKAQVVLYGTEGLATFAAAGETPVRGMFQHKARAFAGIGGGFYEVTAAGTLTRWGTIAIDSNPVAMDTNDPFGQLGIASGYQFYLFNLNTNALTNPTGNVSQVVMIDGRFVALDVLNGILRISGRNDGSTWDPTQTTVRTTLSDPWIAMGVTTSKELILLGGKTGDVYYDSGASPFPFVARQGIVIEPGIKAPYSLKKLHGALLWLASSETGAGQIVRMAGYEPVRISDHSVETAISLYAATSRIDDAVAFVYDRDGHWFYELNFPTAGATWVWDETTGWWHERGTYNGALGTWNAWSPQYHAYAFGQHLVGDFRTGTIYTMALTNFFDAGGAALRRMRQVPGFHQDGRDIYLDRFRIYLETGLGLPTGQGSNPQVMLQTSYKGGKVWNPERWRSAGLQGQFLPYVEWTQLGMARDWGLRVIVSDPVPWRFIDASMAVRLGA